MRLPLASNMQGGKMSNLLNFIILIQCVKIQFRSVSWEKLPKNQKRITYSSHLIVRRDSKRSPLSRKQMLSALTRAPTASNKDATRYLWKKIPKYRA